jgi:hypothetical protein
MRKFSQINENKINESELESILDESGFNYEILHDYYYSPSTSRTYGGFYRDIQELSESSRYSKIIVISPNIEKNSVEVSDWSQKPMSFNSSAFNAIENLEDAQNKYNKVFEIVKRLKSNSPKLIFKDNKFIITLLGESVSKSDLDLKDETIKVKYQLYKDLEDFRKSMNKPYFDVTYVRQGDQLYLTLKEYRKDIYGDFENWEKTWERVVKTLEIQKSNLPGREWMKKIEDIEGLDDIRDSVNEKGFYINLINTSNSDPSKFKIELEEF